MQKSLIKIQLFLLNQTSYILLAVIFILFGLIAPRFFQFQNMENIIKQASYMGIVAVGMTFVLLTAGIDLSVGSNMYLSGVVAGLLIQNFGIPAWLGLLASLITGLLIGLANALLITRLRIIPFVATLGTMVAERGLALLLTQSRAVPFPDSVLEIGSQRLWGLIPLPIIIFMVVATGAQIFLNHTRTGRQIYAVGNDTHIAQKAGLPIHRIQNIAYIFCGTLAALGGFISVAQLGIINAGFGKGDEFDAIAAAVIGGTSLFGGIGTVLPGTVIGAILIQTIAVGLIFSQVDLYLQPLISAAIIFLAVFLDSVRNNRLAKIRRRNIRVDA